MSFQGRTLMALGTTYAGPMNTILKLRLAGTCATRYRATLASAWWISSGSYQQEIFGKTPIFWNAFVTS